MYNVNYSRDKKEGEYLNQLTEGVTHQKYDKSLEDKITMYDNQQYRKDPDLITQDKIKLVSGNVMKYYTFQFDTNQPYMIQTQDELMKEKLALMQYELNMKAAKTKSEEVSNNESSAEATADTELN